MVTAVVVAAPAIIRAIGVFVLLRLITPRRDLQRRCGTARNGASGTISEPDAPSRKSPPSRGRWRRNSMLPVVVEDDRGELVTDDHPVPLLWVEAQPRSSRSCLHGVPKRDQAGPGVYRRAPDGTLDWSSGAVRETGTRSHHQEIEGMSSGSVLSSVGLSVNDEGRAAGSSGVV